VEPRRELTPAQRLGLMALLLGVFTVLYKLVRKRKTEAFDARVTAAAQSLDHPIVEHTMQAVSWAGFPPQSRIIPWLLPIAWAATGRWTEAIVQGLGWGTGLLSFTFKRRMRRPRPHPSQFRFAPARIGGTSFPSGHVINYIGVYGTFAYLAAHNIRNPALRRLVLRVVGTLLALVGPSRVYLGHHWFVDTMASYLLGATWVLGLSGVYKSLSAREDALRHRHSLAAAAATEVVGHGGAGGHHPGNSRPALAAALAMAVDRIEIDVQPAADGTLVLVHDGVVRDAAGVRRQVARMTVDDLRAALTGLLTLDEAVALVGDRAALLIDVKGSGCEPALTDAIRRHDLAGSALVACTDPRVLRTLRAAFPDLRLGLSTGHIATGAPTGIGKHAAAGLLRDITPLPFLALARWCGATDAMIYHRLLDPAFVQAMHEGGLRVFAWTVDAPRTMHRVAALGVDGIISNLPDTLRAELAAAPR
jgi:glycerophosphoryl diester phosphodiesterase/membrane-associated phospholipid phosphatase